MYKLFLHPDNTDLGILVKDIDEAVARAEEYIRLNANEPIYSVILGICRGNWFAFDVQFSPTGSTYYTFVMKASDDYEVPTV